jgi:hypothetical protein
MALEQVAFDELSATKDRPRLQSFKPIIPSSLITGK